MYSSGCAARGGRQKGVRSLLVYLKSGCRKRRSAKGVRSLLVYLKSGCRKRRSAKGVRSLLVYLKSGCRKRRSAKGVFLFFHFRSPSRSLFLTLLSLFPSLFAHSFCRFQMLKLIVHKSIAKPSRKGQQCITRSRFGRSLDHQLARRRGRIIHSRAQACPL